jgi:hypothetical protein
MIERNDQRQDGLLLEAYLDGALDRAEQQRFEADLGVVPALRKEVELQRRIDSALGRLFTEPARPKVAAAPRRMRIHPALLAVAAVLLLASAVTWLFVAGIFHERPDRLGPLYRHTVAAGFEPDIVCTTPEEFAAWVRGNYGQALHPADDPGIEFVGWTYANIVSSYTGILLARVDGEPVIVAMDRRERELQRQGQPQDAALTLHRRRIGELVLYEVTPLGKARVLPLLSRSEPSVSR